MLYGMAEPMHAAIRRLGLRLRVYAPVGELVPGHGLPRAPAAREHVERVLRPPPLRRGPRRSTTSSRRRTSTQLPARPSLPARPPTDPDDPAPYEPEPVREWRRADGPGRVRRRRRARRPSLRRRSTCPRSSTASGSRTAARIDVGRPRPRSTASSPDRRRAPPPTPTRAVAAAVRRGGARGGARPVAERAAVLFRAAEWLRARRDELAALEVFEAGKPWDQADGDVCEAIDFCEYYGREMLRLDAGGGERCSRRRARRTASCYQGKGVDRRSSRPWNFPLAIPTGMTVAALVAGNPVILKPAEQTPAIAWKLVEALDATPALPDGVRAVPARPRRGRRRPPRRAPRRRVHRVHRLEGRRARTSTRPAASHQPGQRHVKRVVAEMGGKNALDRRRRRRPRPGRARGRVTSAFGYAGQKCSAASRLDRRSTPCTTPWSTGWSARPASCIVGHPERHGASRSARSSTPTPTSGMRHCDRPRPGRGPGARSPATTCPTAAGTSGRRSSPTSTRDRLDARPRRDLRPGARRAPGPRLRPRHRAGQRHAVRPHRRRVLPLARATSAGRRDELRAGNVYVNRAITGAVVGRQPFGGYGMSGVGSKAGGPDYLLQFLDPRVDHREHGPPGVRARHMSERSRQPLRLWDSIDRRITAATGRRGRRAGRRRRLAHVDPRSRSTASPPPAASPAASTGATARRSSSSAWWRWSSARSS